MYSKATCQRVGPVGVTKRLVFVPRCKMIVRTVRGRHFTRGGGGGSGHLPGPHGVDIWFSGHHLSGSRPA